MIVEASKVHYNVDRMVLGFVFDRIFPLMGGRSKRRCNGRCQKRRRSSKSSCALFLSHSFILIKIFTLALEIAAFNSEVIARSILYNFDISAIWETLTLTPTDYLATPSLT